MNEAEREQSLVYDTIRAEVRRRVDALIEVACATHLERIIREEVRRAVKNTRSLRSYGIEDQVRREITRVVQLKVQSIRISLGVSDE